MCFSPSTTASTFLLGLKNSKKGVNCVQPGGRSEKMPHCVGRPSSEVRIAECTLSWVSPMCQVILQFCT